MDGEYSRERTGGVLMVVGVIVAIMVGGFVLYSAKRSGAERAVYAEKVAILERQDAARAAEEEAAKLQAFQTVSATSIAAPAPMPSPTTTLEEKVEAEPAPPAEDAKPELPPAKGQQQAMFIEDGSDLAKLNALLKQGWRVVHLAPMGSAVTGQANYDRGAKWKAIVILEW